MSAIAVLLFASSMAAFATDESTPPPFQVSLGTAPTTDEQPLLVADVGAAEQPMQVADAGSPGQSTLLAQAGQARSGAAVAPTGSSWTAGRVFCEVALIVVGGGIGHALFFAHHARVAGEVVGAVAGGYAGLSICK